MEAEAERGVAVGGEIGEAVDEGEEGAQIGVEPVDGFEDLIMLADEVTVAPDKFETGVGKHRKQVTKS